MLKDDLARLCRLCLIPGDWSIDVFNPRGTNGFLVWSIMGELVEIQCSPHDGLPSRICGACMEKLADFKTFKKTCINSRIKLLQLQMNVGLIKPKRVEDVEQREKETSKAAGIVGVAFSCCLARSIRREYETV